MNDLLWQRWLSALAVVILAAGFAAADESNDKETVKKYKALVKNIREERKVMNQRIQAARVVQSTSQSDSHPASEVLTGSLRSYWLSQKGASLPQSLVIRLRGRKQWKVTSIQFYPYLPAKWRRAQAREVKIYFSLTPVGPWEETGLGELTLPRKKLTFQSIPITRGQARYVKIKILSNHGSPQRVGMGQIRIRAGKVLVSSTPRAGSLHLITSHRSKFVRARYGREFFVHRPWKTVVCLLYLPPKRLALQWENWKKEGTSGKEILKELNQREYEKYWVPIALWKNQREVFTTHYLTSARGTIKNLAPGYYKVLVINSEKRKDAVEALKKGTGTTKVIRIKGGSQRSVWMEKRKDGKVLSSNPERWLGGKKEK